MITEPKFKQGDICVTNLNYSDNYFLVLSNDYPIKYVDLTTSRISVFMKNTFIDKFSTIITNDPSVTPDNFADKYPEFLI